MWFLFVVINTAVLTLNLCYCIHVAIFLFTAAVFIGSSKRFICSWGVKTFFIKKEKRKKKRKKEKKEIPQKCLFNYRIEINRKSRRGRQLCLKASTLGMCNPATVPCSVRANEGTFTSVLQLSARMKTTHAGHCRQPLFLGQLWPCRSVLCTGQSSVISSFFLPFHRIARNGIFLSDALFSFWLIFIDMVRTDIGVSI